MEKQHKYNIYPSALNTFQRLLDAEKEFEDFYNVDGEGEYKRTLEEITEEREQDLLNLINRVPQEPIEAADKGTAFNEILDCIIEDREPREGIRLISAWEQSIDGIKVCTQINADINDFKFHFDGSLCLAASQYFADSVCQYTCGATLPTKYGDVWLYGHPDYIRYDKVYDLKTTKSYGWGQYANNWQRYLYPYCLIESGEMKEVSEFEFTVYQWKGGGAKDPILNATQYKECYTYNHQQATEALTQIVERFVEWLEANKELITDKKIFNYGKAEK